MVQFLAQHSTGMFKCEVKKPQHFAKDGIFAVKIPRPNEYTRPSEIE